MNMIQWKTPHKKNGRFFNSHHDKKHSIIFPSVYAYIKQSLQKKLLFSDDYWTISEPIGTDLVWIGHSTFLMNINGIHIITDPVFENLTFFFKRLQKPGIELKQLPSIDVILLSHNHRDHMEQKSLQYIAQKNPQALFLVPEGDAHWLRSWGIQAVSEFSWWQKFLLQRNDQEIQFTFLPAKHWSQRSLFDYNRSLWGSWMVEALSIQQAIYFAGDSAYDEHFKMIADRFDSPSYALMPIAPCEPNRWMKETHMNAEEAGQAMIDLRATCMIPMHWGTYGFGQDAPFTPIMRLADWLKKTNDPLSKPFKVHMLSMGTGISFSKR